MAFTADGETLVSAGYNQSNIGEVFLWEVVDGRQKGEFEGVLILVQDMALSDDRLTLATVGKNGIVRIWDVM